MSVKVRLSKRSQELIQNYQEASHASLVSMEDLNVPVDINMIIRWLCMDLEDSDNSLIKSKKEMEFLQASFRAELLKDLFSALNTKTSQLKEEENVLWSTKFKFFILAIAGTLVAGCEGFDSVTTLLSVFSLPSVITLMAGLAFAVLSIVVFYGFNLVQVSMNLGIKLRDAPKLLDVYLCQREEIKAIRREIESRYLTGRSLEELEAIERIVDMLQKRFKSLIDTSKQFDEAVNSNAILIAKHVFSGMAGLLFFGSGFFAGQSVALFILGLFISSITPACWPVVVFSLLVGLASFSLYWYVERVGLNQLISGWFGLDEDKIELLCDENKLNNEEDKLNNLKEKIVNTIHLTQKIASLEQKVFINQNENNIKDALPRNQSDNIYSFHVKPVDHSSQNVVQNNVEQSCHCHL